MTQIFGLFLSAIQTTDFLVEITQEFAGVFNHFWEGHSNHFTDGYFNWVVPWSMQPFDLVVEITLSSGHFNHASMVKLIITTKMFAYLFVNIN